MKALVDGKFASLSGGICYDGGATLYSTQPLIRSEDELTEDDRELLDVSIANGTYSVRLMFVARVLRPPGMNWHAVKDQRLVQAMDTALLSFARWTAGEERPSWLLSGEKVFRYATYSTSTFWTIVIV